jgi:hypothetical protein
MTHHQPIHTSFTSNIANINYDDDNDNDVLDGGSGVATGGILLVLLEDECVFSHNRHMHMHMHIHIHIGTPWPSHSIGVAVHCHLSRRRPTLILPVRVVFPTFVVVL